MKDDKLPVGDSKIPILPSAMQSYIASIKSDWMLYGLYG